MKIFTTVDHIVHTNKENEKKSAEKMAHKLLQDNVSFAPTLTV